MEVGNLQAARLNLIRRIYWAARNHDEAHRDALSVDFFKLGLQELFDLVVGLVHAVQLDKFLHQINYDLLLHHLSECFHTVSDRLQGSIGVRIFWRAGLDAFVLFLLSSTLLVGFFRPHFLLLVRFFLFGSEGS